MSVVDDYYEYTHSPLPHRFSTHMAQFSYDEKFETWLDLGSWVTVQQHLALIESEDGETNLLKLNKITKRDLSLLRWLAMDLDVVINAKLSPLLPALIIRQTLRTPVTKCHVSEKRMRDYLKMSESSARMALFLQQNHFMTCFGPDLAEQMSKFTGDWSQYGANTTQEMLSFLNIHEDILRVINKHKALVHTRCRSDFTASDKQNLKSLGLNWAMPSIHANITILFSFIILDWCGATWLIPIPYFLEVYNKITEMITYLKYNHILSKSIYPESHYLTSVKFMEHLAKQTIKFMVSQKPFTTSDQRHSDLSRENKGFIYLKMIEGLGVAELIHRSDGAKNWDNTMLVETLWTTVVEEKLSTKLVWDESPLRELFQLMDSAQLASLIGTVKLCGHPSIEIEKGLQKLYDRTHNSIQVDPVVCDRARGVMTRDIILNFYRTQGRYPRLTEQSLLDVPVLAGMIRRNVSLLSEEGKQGWDRITTMDWTKVHFGKNGEFDIIENQVMLLKDKALGLVKSKVLRKALLTTAETSTAKSYRRALLAFLLDAAFDKGFKRYMNDYMEDDPWRHTVLDYLVIKLTAKELEEKVEGRFFGASPAYERNRRVVQEGNVMSFMDKLVPEQLLTPNELSVIKKMFSFRYLKQAHPDSTILNISFDFSKWNNNMRHESVDIPAGTVLDEWFDTNLYRKTMRAFENMYVYYDDGIINRAWEGQLGGIEGLNQATWTLTFLGGLKDALENLGYIYHITVKGDDVRCAIVIPNRVLDVIPGSSFQERIETVRDKLMKNLQDLCQSMGWELNPQESFVSLSLICTSKQYQVNDTWLPTDVKKIMKCEALSNVAFPTLEDMISNIFSIAHSCCSQATVIVPSYATACWTAARLLTRTLMNTKTIRNLSSDMISSLLLWPQVLGGPGSLPIQTFFVRGENDMLSVSISLLRHLWRVLEDDPMQRYIGFILSQKLKKSSDFVMLLSDPYAIDIDIPVRPASKIKSTLRQTLKRICKHKEIKTLLTTRAEQEKVRLMEILSSLTPYYAKIATAIWECSPYYLIEEVLAKFLNSSSILGFITRGDYFHQYSRAGSKLLQNVKQASQDRLDYWILVLQGYKVRSDDTFFGITKDDWNSDKLCSTAITHKIRCLAWGKNIQGITYPSLIDQIKIYSINDLNDLRLTRGWDPRTVYSQIHLLHMQAEFQIDSQSHHFASAPNATPWLGSETKSNVTLPFQSDNIASPSIRKVRRLLTLLSSAPHFGNPFGQLIRKLLEAYTSISPDLINLLKSEEGGGHLAHRTPINSYSMVTMPNYRPNLSQLISIHNEDIMILKTDRVNRTINFASRHFFLVCAVFLPLQTQPLLPAQYPKLLYSAFHHDLSERDYYLCPHCCNAVPDEKVQLDDSSDLDLSRFLDIKIVGCSEAEEIGFSKAAKTILYKGVLSLITRLNLNPQNPIVVRQATRATIQRLLASSNQTYNNLKFEKILSTPNTQLLDVLSVGLGLKPLLGCQIQMSVLRCCQPEFVYESLLSEGFWHALYTAYGKDTLYTSQPLGALIPEMYESTARVFDQLSKAEMLHEISYVALNKPPAGIDAIVISWRHSSESQGGVAAKSFFSAVWPTFNKWISKAEYPEYIINRIVESKTIDGIQASCLGHQRLMIRLTFHILHLAFADMMGSTQGPLHRLGIMIMALPDPTDNRRVEDTVLGWSSDRRIQGQLLRIAMLLTVSDWLVSAELTQEVIQHSVSTGIPVSLMDLDLDVVFPEPLRMLANIQFLTDTQLMCLHYVGKSISPTLTVEQATICRKIVLFQVATELERNDVLYSEYLEVMRVHITKVLPLYSRKFYLSCNETDSRLIKDNFNLLSPSELEEKFPKLVVKPIRAIDDKDSTILWSKRYCLMKPHPTIPSGRVNLTPAIVTEASTDLRQLGNELNLQKTTLLRRRFHIKCVTSSYNLTRIFMGLNKASSRYYDILNRFGILRSMDRVKNPVCLVLGDGGGSVSLLLKTVFPSAQVVVTSLQVQENSKNVIPDGYLNSPPVEFQQPHISQEFLTDIHWRGFFPGDFTLPEIREQLYGRIRDIKGSADLLISDADFPSTESDYMLSVCSIITAHLEGCNVHAPLIIRLIIKKSMPVTAVITLIYGIYNHCHLIASPLSNGMTQEFWAVCSEPQPPAVTTPLIDHLAALDNPSNWAIDMNMSKILELQNEFRMITEGLRAQSGAPLLNAAEWNQIIRDNWSVPLPLSHVKLLLEFPHLESLWSPSCFCQSLQEFARLLYNSQADESQSLPGVGHSPRFRKLREDRQKDILGWASCLKRIIDIHVMMQCADDPLYVLDFNHMSHYVRDLVGYLTSLNMFGPESSYTLITREMHTWVEHPASHFLGINLDKEVHKVMGIAIRLISSRSKLWERLIEARDDEDKKNELLDGWSHGLRLCTMCLTNVVNMGDLVAPDSIRSIGFKICKS